MALELLEALNDALERRETVALVTVIRSQAPSQVGAKMLVWADRPPFGDLGLGETGAQVLQDATEALRGGRHRTLRYPDLGLEVFVEVQRRAPRLIIVGAGHIAVPLCELASLCDFSVIVIDDRPQFANRGRFSKAEQVVVDDLRQAVGEWARGDHTYVVLVTRGHTLDVECLLEILDRPLAYIGMIGSRRRVRAVFDLLVQEQGIPMHKLDRVYAPIGLPIAAETPAEIALAIMAEIVNVYRHGDAPSLADERRQGERNHPQRVARRP